MVSFSHRHMIEHPALWPVWPFLPVKRPDPVHQFQCGFMIEAEDAMNTVFVGFMFRVGEDGYIESLPKIEYDSIDAILADGWVVD